MRALLGGKTYLEKAGLLVAHPGAEAQRWHMDTPHLFASRRATPTLRAAPLAACAALQLRRTPQIHGTRCD